MLRLLLKEVKEYKRASIATPLFMILEVVMEMCVPFLMASIIDNGVNKGDMAHIYKVGAIMIVAAGIGLFAGLMGGRLGAKASTGFAKNLRSNIFHKIQTYSFENIDKYSSSSLVTRLTTDVANVQMSYMMLIRTAIRSPLMLLFSIIMAYRMGGFLATAFVIVVPFLAFGLYLIAKKAMPAFRRVFKKYDKLNE